MTKSLPFFPARAPDELLYSLVARYRLMAGGLSSRPVMSDVFGNSRCAAVWDLPCHVGYLARAIGESPSDLVGDHTLFPYYSSTLMPGRSTELKRWMIGESHGGSIHLSMGVTASSVPATQHLRYCPLCVESDRTEWGAAYWHRVHQCPGVWQCPIHECALIETSISLAARTNKHCAVALEEVTVLEDGHVLEDCGSSLIKAMALRTWDLLKGQCPQNAVAWRAHHLGVCRRLGFVTPHGSIRRRVLLEWAPKLAHIPLWKRLGLPTDLQAEGHWLLSMFHKPRAATHPLHHILLDLLLENIAVLPLAKTECRRGHAAGRVTKKPIQTTKSREVNSEDKRQWQRLSMHHRHSGAADWRRRAPALYARLYRHDRKWLLTWNREHDGAVKPARGPRVPWLSEDRRLAGLVPSVAAQLVDSSAMTHTRLTRSVLLRALGRPGLHRSQLAKLPRLRRRLEQTVETKERFLTRRLEQAAREWTECYDLRPKPWEILRHAGVHWPWSPHTFDVARSVIDASAAINRAGKIPNRGKAASCTYKDGRSGHIRRPNS